MGMKGAFGVILKRKLCPLSDVHPVDKYVVHRIFVFKEIGTKSRDKLDLFFT